MADEFIPGRAVTVAGFTVVPVARVRVGGQVLAQGFCLYGSREPVAVIVCGPRTMTAFDLEGQGRSAQEWLRKVPALAAIVARSGINRTQG